MKNYILLFMIILVSSLIFNATVFNITGNESYFINYYAFAQVLQSQPLEFTNPRVVDAFGNIISEISVDQQVQFTADIKNNLDKDVEFAYVVTYNDLETSSWISATLTPGQTFSPAVSIIFQQGGTYIVEFYVVKPVAQILKPEDPKDHSVFAITENQLSPPRSIKINVDDPNLQKFEVPSEYDRHDIDFITTSEISNVFFEKENKKLAFTVSGPSGTPGSLTARFTVFLLDDIFEVTRGGQPLDTSMWSVKRVGIFNELKIVDYFHSSHDFAGFGLTSSEDLKTNSGHIIRYNWTPYPIGGEDIFVDEYDLDVTIRNPDERDPETAKFNVKIKKSNSIKFNQLGTTGDTGTGNLIIGKNVLYKPPNVSSEEYDMEIILLEYGGEPIGELALPMQRVVVIPEYPYGVLIILMSTILFVILITKFKILSKPISF